VLPVVFKHISEIQDWIALQRASLKAKIGFVPTMGALHAGHVSLIKRAKETCDIVVVSIFVNPTQFNNPDDLKHYPRTFEKDRDLLAEAGCDAIFFPSVDEMYPTVHKDSWDFGLLSNTLEGDFRQGHFDGVLTVVKKLFEIVLPDEAYFGEKDFQQLSLIRKMAEHEKLTVHVIGSPLIREENGLAMSSRNMRLSEDEKQQAIVISKALYAMRDSGRMKTPQEVITLGKSMMEEAGIEVEYLSIVEADTFVPVEQWERVQRPIALVAAYVGRVRLIDNMFL
jgi:pantoate--beta-alanine ligase